MANNKLRKISSNSLVKRLKEKRERKEENLPKEFGFKSLLKKFKEIIKTFPDCREGKNISKTLIDAALGGFVVLFTQNSSFLSYQKTMQQTQGKNNASSLFGIKEILSDNHIRNLLDEVPPATVFPMFSYILDELDQRGYLDQFRSYNNNLLVALDGTQYFSSNKIHCVYCNQAHHKEGVINYSHSVITPVIVKPGSEKVISLIPEFITPQDGHQKQDCENAASKRWLGTYGSILKKLKVTILGDDLYCHQSICEKILSEGLNFILVCKEDSHKTLYEYVRFLKEDVQTLEVRRWHGKKLLLDRYRFLNGVPLRGGEDAQEVNWCELITTNEGSGESESESESGSGSGSGSGKVIYKNTFVSNMKITQENVKEIVANGRSRWKIENENNNTLKTKGYNMEHNFGHGKKNLSMLLLTFNLLAFLFHTVLDMVDERYELIRQTLPTRRIFFQDVRALTRYFYFSNWNALMKFMIKRLELEFPKVVDTT